MAVPPQEPNGHTRRPRYRGTHPRRFEEKYKELAPEQYPDIVRHLREQGRTPAGQHVPVMIEETLGALAIRPGERGVDATLGWGGHAERFLERLSSGGQLLALDADPVELPKTEARLRRLGFGADRLIVRRTNFAGLRKAIAAAGWDGVDFVFADLGVSSMQIDNPSRGFSFKGDGPLDMRINPNRGLSAAQWLDRATVDGFARVLAEAADEPRSAELADAILTSRAQLTTTGALVRVIRAALGPRLPDEERDRTVRRVFQALRIQVNDEFGALDALLRQLPDCLLPNGRAAFLTFHSGEDRRVKKSFDEGLRAGRYRDVSDEMIRPSAAEQRSNPRSASAKLRSVRMVP